MRHGATASAAAVIAFVTITGLRAACAQERATVTPPPMTPSGATDAGRPIGANPIGSIHGVPQPISVDELPLFLQCPSLSEEEFSRALTALREYRAEVVALRQREILPLSLDRMSGADKSEDFQRRWDAAWSKRERADRRLQEQLRAVATDPGCAELLSIELAAIDRRMLRDQIGTQFLLAYSEEVGPVIRRAANTARTELSREAIESLRLYERRLQELLAQLAQERAAFSTRYRATMAERGLKMPDSAQGEPDAAVSRQFQAALEQLAREVAEPARALANQMGALSRSTLAALRAQLPEELWRTAHDRWYEATYRGPLMNGPGSPLLCLRSRQRAAESADPPDVAAVTALQEVERRWRSARDAATVELADAIDRVRAADRGDDTDALIEACETGVSAFERINATTFDEIAALGRACPVSRMNSNRESAWGIRRVHEGVGEIPPRAATRRFEPLSRSPSEKPRRRGGMVVALEQEWLDHLLDRAGASETQRAVLSVRLADDLAAMQDAVDALAKLIRQVSNERSTPGGGAGSSDERVRARAEYESQLIAREDAFFAEIREVLGWDDEPSWPALLVDLARRDRMRAMTRLTIGGSTTDLAPSSEADLDLVRLIDERAGDELRQSDAWGPILARLGIYSRDMSAAVDRMASAANSASDAPRGAIPAGEEPAEWTAWYALTAVNRAALDDLSLVVADSALRQSLRGNYGRAAWPAVFGSATEMEMAPALEAVEEQILVMLLHAPLRGSSRAATIMETLEPMLQLDGARWQREELKAERWHIQSRLHGRASTEASP